MSKIIVWDQTYSVGIELIDNQHKKLFEHLNSYYESILAGKDKDVINNILGDVINYAVYHFAEEEKVMNSIEKVDFSSHFQEHKNFCSKVSEIKEKVSSGKEISYELFNFMKEWIHTHILLVDQKVGEAYRKNK